jgi:hypothetical protein
MLSEEQILAGPGTLAIPWQVRLALKIPPCSASSDTGITSWHRALTVCSERS